MSKDYIGPFGPEEIEAGRLAVSLLAPALANNSDMATAVISAAVSALDLDELAERMLDAPGTQWLCEATDDGEVCGWAELSADRARADMRLRLTAIFSTEGEAEPATTELASKRDEPSAGAESWPDAN